MRKSASFLFICTLLTTVLFLYSCTKENRPQDESDSDIGRVLEYTGKVSFIKSESDTVSTIEVAVADDNRSRSEGLMNVMKLPENTGMLFIFENEQPRSFWMANTPLPLDIIFVNEELNIVRIHRNTRPYSQESIQSEEPARFVVEVNAGYTLEHDIREGMRIDVEGVEF